MHRTSRFLLGAVLAIVACAPAEERTADWVGTIDTVADTISVVTHSGNLWGRIDSVALVWRSDSTRTADSDMVL